MSTQHLLPPSFNQLAHSAHSNNSDHSGHSENLKFLESCPQFEPPKLEPKVNQTAKANEEKSKNNESKSIKTKDRFNQPEQAERPERPGCCISIFLILSQVCNPTCCFSCFLICGR